MQEVVIGNLNRDDLIQSNEVYNLNIHIVVIYSLFYLGQAWV